MSEKKCSDSSCTKESCSNCSKAKVDFSVAPHPLSHVKTSPVLFTRRGITKTEQRIAKEESGK